MSSLFWNSQTAALAVSLTPAQFDFFNVCGTRSHVWESLLLLVKKKLIGRFHLLIYI